MNSGQGLSRSPAGNMISRIKIAEGGASKPVVVNVRAAEGDALPIGGGIGLFAPWDRIVLPGPRENIGMQREIFGASVELAHMVDAVIDR